ncbi:hypothetical protein [Microbacterium thalli]|uniref:hypothetical protein n=1 Tax=Microbacterium thalli TaxID=3027921 RepID=UPI002365AE25|nr:hypothetical protein [Microbacterium thalli]MDD7928203.1 hypothetical protein [Microbacterium thalli]
MSDGGAVDIRDGGVVAVDTAELRAAASDLGGLAAACEVVRGEVDRVVVGLTAHAASAWSAVDLAVGLARAVDGVLDETRAEAEELARALDGAADVYEIVELEAAARAATLADDQRSLPLMTRRLAEARSRMPDAAAEADLLLAAWPLTRHGPLHSQIGLAATPLGAGGGVVVAASGLALTVIAALGRGSVPRSDRLSGAPVPVSIAPHAAAAASGPRTLATLAERMPRGDDQLRVERYPQPGGGNHFAVFVAGTRSPLGFGGSEPLDMTSNVQLYSGARSASYDAVIAALRDAGARPGDEVLAIGHSQGGAITSRLATDSPFTVVGNVTFGSPVQVAAPAHTTEVTVRHTDDPIPALQAGGHPVAVGGPASFVAERVADPGAGIGDLALGAHAMDAYGETAALVDGSDDPRVSALHELLSEFAGDAPAVVTTYEVRRPE